MPLLRAVLAPLLALLAVLPSEARWTAMRSGHEIPLAGRAARLVSEGRALEASDIMIYQIQAAWEWGIWSASGDFHASDPDPACGRSTLQELSMPIHEWQRRNPGADGFCHFRNQASWFAGVAEIKDYREYGRQGAALARLGIGICDSVGDGWGPSRSISYDAGAFTWTHLDSCIDLIDDPYCFSLGMLKNQRSDTHLMSNYTAWKAVGKAECAMIQEEFNFLPEQTTVGRHVAMTPFYFRGASCALFGNCSSVTRRTHKEHVYTKCLLGDIAQEMAYCYYKGCLLPGNRVGHGSECDY